MSGVRVNPKSVDRTNFVEWPERIDSAIRLSGLNQSQVADHFGIGQQAVSKWCSGATKPNVEQIVELASLLGIPVGLLVDPRMGDADRETIDNWKIIYRYVDKIGVKPIADLILFHEKRPDSPKVGEPAVAIDVTKLDRQAFGESPRGDKPRGSRLALSSWHIPRPSSPLRAVQVSHREHLSISSFVHRRMMTPRSPRWISIDWRG